MRDRLTNIVCSTIPPSLPPSLPPSIPLGLAGWASGWIFGVEWRMGCGCGMVGEEIV